MTTRALLIATVVSIATLISSQAEELTRKTLAQSIPEEVIFCARLQMNVARKNEEAARILNATKKQFKERLDAIGQFSGLDLNDVDCIWVGVVKDKEALVILEGTFDAELILNSQVVTTSRRLVRRGTIVAIEMKDEKKDELTHAVVINDHIIAFGLPDLVDDFITNYVNKRSGWDKNGLSVMESLAASNATLHVAVMQVPEEEIKQKPFLATFVNAQMELNIEEKVAATARITMQDEGKATALKDLISGFVGLGLTSEIKTDYPEIKKAICDGLKLSSEGKTVTLSSRMDTELLRSLLKAKGLALN
jgi:hypothetical protein